MAKKIKTVIKLNLSAGAATPAPPVGPALGQHGVNIMQFVTSYNEATKDQKGQLIPAEVTIFEDRTFTFVTKLPPVSELIKQKIKIQKGSGNTPKEMVGEITHEQIRQIAEMKLPDLNTKSIESVMKTIEGTARSMGVKIKE